jgi:hypothetical protein
LLPAFVGRECGMFETRVRVLSEDHRADEIVERRTGVVDEVSEERAPSRVGGSTVPRLMMVHSSSG